MLALYRSVYCVLALASVRLPVSAQQVPATAPAPLPASLAVSINLSANAQPIETLLEGLNAANRLHLQAKNAAQWERVSVYAKDIPIHSIMQGLQHLLNYPWIASTAPPAGNLQTLTATARMVEYEKTLWNATLLHSAAPLFKLPDYLQTSEEAYQRLDKDLDARHKEPDDLLLRHNLYYLARSAPRTGLRLLTTLTPEQRLTLLQENRYILSPNAMTEPQSRLCQALGIAVGTFRARVGIALPDETPEESGAMADRLGLILSVHTDPLTGAVLYYGYGLGGGINIAADFNRMPPPEDLLPVRGKPYNLNLARMPKIPTYPALARLPFPAEFALDNDTDLPWHEVMAKLSKSLKQSLFSDDYGFTNNPKGRQGTKLPRLTKLNLVEGLDALCNHYRYLWWYEDGMFFFRSRTWFLEKQYEVPPVLALLKQRLQATGKFDAECLTVLSTLTQQQLQGLNMLRAAETGEKNLGQANAWGDGAKGAYNYLQVYALLDAEQKEKVFSSEGLSQADMSQVQQEALMQLLLREHGPEVFNWPRIPLRVEQNISPSIVRQEGNKPDNAVSTRFVLLSFCGKGKYDSGGFVQAGYKPE